MRVDASEPRQAQCLNPACGDKLYHTAGSANQHIRSCRKRPADSNWASDSLDYYKSLMSTFDIAVCPHCNQTCCRKGDGSLRKHTTLAGTTTCPSHSAPPRGVGPPPRAVAPPPPAAQGIVSGNPVLPPQEPDGPGGDGNGNQPAVPAHQLQAEEPPLPECCLCADLPVDPDDAFACGHGADMCNICMRAHVEEVVSTCPLCRAPVTHFLGSVVLPFKAVDVCARARDLHADLMASFVPGQDINGVPEVLPTLEQALVSACVDMKVHPVRHGLDLPAEHANHDWVLKEEAFWAVESCT